MRIKFCLLVIVSWLPLSSFAQNPLCPNPLKVGWGDYPPFTMVDSDQGDGSPTGIDIELFKMMAGDVGCEVEFVNKPWTTQLHDIKSGIIDIVTSTSKTSAREKIMYFASPYIKDTNALFMTRENIKKYRQKINSFSDMLRIPNFKLGVTKGNFYGNEFEKAKENPEFAKLLVQFNSDKEVLLNAEQDEKETDNSKKDKSKKSAVTAFLSDIVFTYEASDKLNISEHFDIYPLTIRNDGLYFGFSKKLPKELVEQLDNSMNKFINVHFNNDAFYDILSRYLYKNQIDMLRVK